MGLTQDKRAVSAVIQKLAMKDYVQENAHISSMINRLAADMANSFYTIVVLGEFKRGKSTFVNALLGKSILPMDVLPETATINAIMYSDEPMLKVIYNDGSEEEGDTSREFLQKFSAQQKSDLANKVKYIKIGYPLDLLKNRVVLVDTPGVSDMDEQRCDVTYQFIPKANAVLFLLDANSPLKKTERDFIEQRLLPLGIDNIMFLLNKYDCVDDEEEEDEDLLGDVQQRLTKAFSSSEKKLKNVKVYPLSAKYALDGLEHSNMDMVKTSGLLDIKAELDDMVFHGDIEAEKIQRYKKQLHSILTITEHELSNLRHMKEASADDLHKLIEGLTQMMAEKEQNQANIAGYVNDSKQQIYAIIDKSLKFFHAKLAEDIEDKIMMYQGLEFKTFVEQVIPKVIRKNIESWLGIYTPHIDSLLKQLQDELSYGMSMYFNQQIKIYTKAGTEVKSDKFTVNIAAEDMSSMIFKSGAIAAVGGIGLISALSSTLMPLVGLAILPWLKDRMMKKKLAEVKGKTVPEIKTQLIKIMVELQKEIHKYVDERCSRISADTAYAYEQVLIKLKQQLLQQIDEKKLEGEQIQFDISKIDDALADISKFKEELA